MVSCGQIPDLVTYSILLDYLCKNCHLPEAMTLLKAIEGSNMDPNIPIYTIVIDGMCRADELEVARDLSYYLCKGLNPSTWTYNIMLNGLFKRGLLDEANNLFIKMERNDYSPNDHTYNTITRGSLQNKETESYSISRGNACKRIFS